ncbi:hypothetical protein CV093_15960 [Oceanobacillus sp. 143]|nr:hypothetical protein CV093_15960 [Oceanobacillus sp. 143]
MELSPNDPKPVTYLSKIYKKIGNHDEANAYQQLLIQMTNKTAKYRSKRVEENG